MTKAEFKHYDLTLVEPTFNSPLTGLIINLNHLRKKRLDGTTPSQVFFNLKSIFHMLENIGSARIEGNNTSLSKVYRLIDRFSEKIPNFLQEMLQFQQ